MTKRAVIYCRVSLDRTGEQASVNRQEEACRALCIARGWTVVDVKIDNSISAYDEDKVRPAWNETLALAAAGAVDVIVSYHIDRMTRSMTALEELILLTDKHGVGVATTTGDIDLTTDTGRMVARILAAVARAEVERKAARQKLANFDNAKAGKPYTSGSRAFGYTQDGMTIIETEAELIRQAATDVINGKPLALVAREWGAAGLLSSHGTTWTKQGVRDVLLNLRNVAIRKYGDVEYPGVWPAIFDLETYLRVRETLTDPNRRKTKDSHAGGVAENLLTRIATCEHCDGPIYASGSRGLPTYGCLHRHVTAPRGDLDLYVEKHMIALLGSPGFLRSLAPTGDKRVARAEKELDRLDRQLRRIRTSFNAGAYDDDEAQYETDVRETRKLMDEQKLIIAETGTARTFDGFDFTNVAASWNGAGFEHKRAMITAAFSITLRRRDHARDRWNPEKHVVLARRG